MNYNLKTPCDECPFLNTPNFKRGFTLARLKEFSSAEFPCHKTCDVDDDGEEPTGDFIARENSSHCAGALIFNHKRKRSTQMMRIAERTGAYNRMELDMKAKVR